MSNDIEGFPYCDDPSLRDTYVETIQLVYRQPGIVRIEFCASRWTQEAPVRVRAFSPVARIAMPLESAKKLCEQLNQAIENLENQVKAAPFLPAAAPKH